MLQGEGGERCGLIGKDGGDEPRKMIMRRWMGMTEGTSGSEAQLVLARLLEWQAISVSGGTRPCGIKYCRERTSKRTELVRLALTVLIWLGLFFKSMTEVNSPASSVKNLVSLKFSMKQMHCLPIATLHWSSKFIENLGASRVPKVP